MNDSQTNPKHLVDEHLDAVEAVLSQGGMNRPERRRIIDEIEVQVHEMLAIYGENPCVADVQSVLAKLDPPEAYAAAGEPAVASMPEKTSAPDSEPKYSKLAIVGALWIPLFIVIALTTAGGPTNFFATLVIIAALMAPFGTTILGWVAVSQIRHSRGRLYGTGLALFDGLFFPLLILDWLVLAAWSALFICGIWLLAPVAFHARLSWAITLALTIPLAIYSCFIVDRKIVRRCLTFARKPV